MFCKKGVLINFARFTGKHLCQSLLFNKVAVLRPATLLKKRLWHRCFLVNFVKFSRTPFFVEHVWWLLLDILEKACYLLVKMFDELVEVKYFKNDNRFQESYIKYFMNKNRGKSYHN